VSKNLSECHAYIFHFTKCSNPKIDKLAIGVPYQDKTNIGVGNQQNVTRAIVETQGLFLIKQFAGLMTGHVRRHFQQYFLKCVSNFAEM